MADGALVEDHGLIDLETVTRIEFGEIQRFVESMPGATEEKSPDIFNCQASNGEEPTSERIKGEQSPLLGEDLSGSSSSEFSDND
mmetsp:Transcript_10886/g.20823  ORF Transcript_10886/g.20823 Transcript_10886/m.20823 type:complete len:85 (-) Transcript_10886:254-508(-)